MTKNADILSHIARHPGVTLGQLHQAVGGDYLKLSSRLQTLRRERRIEARKGESYKGWWLVGQTPATQMSLEQENAELRRLLLDHHNWIAAAMRVLQPLQQGWMSPPTFETAKALLSDPEPVGSGK